MSSKAILRTLRALKPTLETRYKVKKIGVFGSLVRNELKKASDIDILAEFQEGADLFDLVALALFLEEKLGRKVDVVSQNALRVELRTAVLQEVVPI